MLTMVWVLCVCCVPAPSPLSPSQGIGDRSGAFSGVCIFACVPCVAYFLLYVCSTLTCTVKL